MLMNKWLIYQPIIMVFRLIYHYNIDSSAVTFKSYYFLACIYNLAKWHSKTTLSEIGWISWIQNNRGQRWSLVRKSWTKYSRMCKTDMRKSDTIAKISRIFVEFLSNLVEFLWIFCRIWSNFSRIFVVLRLAVKPGNNIRE